jgi:hypothetical protein
VSVNHVWYWLDEDARTWNPVPARGIAVSSPRGHQHSARAVVEKIALGIGVLVGVVVIGSVALVVWAIAKGEEQSHERANQVASGYRSTRSHASEAAVREVLGEPSLVAIETFRGRTAHCWVYRVLLPARELVPYRFCFVDGRLVSRSRSWDDVPSD